MTCRSTASQIRFDWISEPNVPYGSLADITARSRYVGFTPQRRTFISSNGTSAMCQKQTWLGYREGKLSANISVLTSIDSNPELHRKGRRTSARKTHAASGTSRELCERR